jgi:hypothetical protein
MSRVQGRIEVDGPAGAFERPLEAVPGLQLDPWVLGGGADPVRAEVWFDPQLAPVLRRELPSDAVVRDDAEGLVVVLDVTNREGFRSWVLSFLERAEVLGPPELRDELVEHLRALAGEHAS